MQRLRTILGLIVLLFFMLSCQTAKDSKKEQPNVIVMLVDDAGYADFGFAGCKDLKTPNIDKLANNGIIFTDAHVSATVCGPSRAGIMTGRYQQRFGFECNPSLEFTGIDLDETTIADAMKQAGYKTSAFGKWHLGDAPEYQPNARGFDYFWGFLSGGRSYFPDKKVDKEGHTHSIQENGKFTTFEGYLTDCLGDKAVEFIDRNKESPFFMYWAPNAVHSPMHAIEEDLALFDGHPRQKLAAMTWSLDRAVGSITHKLEQENLLDNTLIFFLSDNGGAHYNQSSNYPLKGYKGNKYEGGHRVQFFMHWPKQIKKGTFSGLSSALDIFATSVAVSNRKVKTNHPLDGVNLMPFLTGEKEGNPHEQLFWRKGPEAAMRDADYKMVRVEGLGQRLYNLKNNLGETEDLCVEEKTKLDQMNNAMGKWENGLMQPLWREGALWDTITYMIHEDYFFNRELRARDPNELRKWKRRNGIK